MSHCVNIYFILLLPLLVVKGEVIINQNLPFQTAEGYMRNARKKLSKANLIENRAYTGLELSKRDNYNKARELIYIQMTMRPTVNLFIPKFLSGVMKNAKAVIFCNFVF